MNGLIGFFDILGYQSFLENNSAADSAEKVLKLITDIPANIKANTSRVWLNLNVEEPDKYPTQFADVLKHQIFSDTIVLSIEYPLETSTDWKENALVYMTSASAALSLEMFLGGLP